MDTIIPTEDEKRVVEGSSEASQETLHFSTNAEKEAVKGKWEAVQSLQKAPPLLIELLV